MKWQTANTSSNVRDGMSMILFVANRYGYNTRFWRKKNAG
jgi:hypothetical protein